MRDEIEIGGLKLPKKDWEAIPASVRLLVTKLLQDNQALQARLAQLEERLNQTSKNSSRPPSTDEVGVKKSTRPKPSNRKRGGQPGHPGHQRQLYASEACTTGVDCIPAVCQQCGWELSGTDVAP